ncbi:hypothetical protein ACWEIJ_04645 [Lentzea sp. NPDC004789]
MAGLQIGGAPFCVHQVDLGNPAETSPGQVTHVARAVAAGAVPGSPVVDHRLPWGTHRQGGFTYPFGHRWSVGDRSPLP